LGEPPVHRVDDVGVEPELVVIGLIAAPGPCAELAEAMEPDLADRIAARIPGTRWEVRYLVDRLVEWPTDLSELRAAVHRRTLAEGWQLSTVVIDAIGHPMDLGGQLKLAWLASSLVTLGGALGAVLETDEAVREAAYGYQPDRRLPDA
jgi:hypothetical protein